MPGTYAALPKADPDADAELEGAFASDDEDTLETTPLHKLEHASHTPLLRSESLPRPVIPGAYDFERVDYDAPPPGSPPRPSALALPNDFGNSNGVVGSEPTRPRPPRMSFFRRAVGALLPSHYERVPTEGGAGPAVGGGTSNDGVFSNMAARPARNVAVTAEDGTVHMVPEDAQREQPPAYAVAQLDNAPTYWEATATVPGLDPNADMIVEDLPTGSVFLFISNIAISFLFQFVGFLITYLMHTTHAAKYGSRVGLGLTLIQYGSYRANLDEPPMDDATFYNGNGTVASWPGQTDQPINPANITLPDGLTPTEYARLRDNWVASGEWMSFFMMTMGWFLVITSVLGYWRVKRWERSIRASATPVAEPAAPTGEELHRAIEIRRMLFSPFGRSTRQREEESRHEVPDEELSEEDRLERNLRRAGLL